MYIPIGNDMAVRDRSIVGIFDLDNCTREKRSREFLAAAERAGQIIPATDDLPKSFLLTSEYGLTKVYLVQFNSTTIEKRSIERPQEYPVPERKNPACG